MHLPGTGVSIGDQFWDPSTNKTSISCNATFFKFYFEPKLAQVVLQLSSGLPKKGESDGSFIFSIYIMADNFPCTTSSTTTTTYYTGCG